MKQYDDGVFIVLLMGIAIACVFFLIINAYEPNVDAHYHALFLNQSCLDKRMVWTPTVVYGKDIYNCKASDGSIMTFAEVEPDGVL